MGLIELQRPRNGDLPWIWNCRIWKDHKLRKDEVNWITAGFMAAFHVGAVAALFFFTWKALFVAMFLWWVSGSLGIGMSYHRLLTHRGYKTPKWVEYFLTICATLALEGGPIFWVATHRIHHQFSDQEGDPHSPIDGKWWAHMGWILMGKSMHHDTTTLARYVPDLAKDKFHVWLTKYHYVPQIVAWRSVVRHRRPALAAVGNIPAHGSWTARHLAGELGDAFVGNAAICDARPFDQQLVGRSADVWRRLAQQSPRASDRGAARLHLVRSRHELVRHLGPEDAGAGVGHQASQAGRNQAGSGGIAERAADCTTGCRVLGCWRLDTLLILLSK